MPQKRAERELDILSYNRKNPPPSDLQESDIRASFQGTSSIAKVNHILIGGALKRGFVARYALLSFESPTENPQALLPFAENARGSFLYCSIFPAHLDALWKLLRLLQEQKWSTPLGIQGFHHLQLRIGLERDNARRNERRGSRVG